VRVPSTRRRHTLHDNRPMVGRHDLLASPPAPQRGLANWYVYVISQKLTVDLRTVKKPAVAPACWVFSIVLVRIGTCPFEEQT